MSIIELIAVFVVLFGLGILVAFSFEIRDRVRHLREHPQWKPGEPFRH